MLASPHKQKGDSMRFLITWTLSLAALVGMYSTIGRAAELSVGPSVQAENLLRETIVGAESKEVIVSRVSFPANTELPWHWHPGEEIFYVIEGAVTLSRRGLPDTAASAGEVHKIAPKVIHAGRTGEAGAELVIFRVHAAGEPERYLVD